MNVLVINAGSSSLKYQLIDVDTAKVFAKGNCERIGLENAFVTHETGGEKRKIDIDLPNHKAAVQEVFDLLKEQDIKIDGIGHRVVMGGVYFPESAIATPEALAKVREVAPLAPLHNYAEADVIEICQKSFPEIGNVIVPDTAFHFDMPEVAWRYALPRKVTDRLHIRKYGAHGTSHRYIWRATKEFMGDKTHKLVSAHIGSGASLCAIHDGKSIETTMGLTPLDGLIMGTRTGTIDPATVVYLQREGGYSVDEVDTMMNKESGVLALSEISSDMRDVCAGAEKGDKNAQLALAMYAYRAGQLIMEMAQSMQGWDTLAFSAGVGENSHEVRKMICDNLAWVGLKLDEEKNLVRSDAVREISTPDSSIHVLVVPTNEELMIATDVAELLG